MQLSVLKEYLGIVLDLEENLNEQKQALSELTGKRDKLCLRNNFEEPIEPLMPQKPKGLEDRVAKAKKQEKKASRRLKAWNRI